MQRKQLTEQIISALAPKRKRYVIYDSEVRSLGIRVSPRGLKTFVVVKRINGAKHPTRRRIGVVGKLTIDQARERALKFDAKRSDKFGAVAEQYFAHIAKQRRASDVENAIRRDLLPQLGPKAIGAITKDDVRKVVNAIKARGKLGSAEHALSYAKRLFNYAVDNDLIAHSPCDRLRASTLIGKRTKRQRVLTDEELRALWRACERRGYPFGYFAQLLLVTGQRRGDIAFAPWSEFDLDSKLWTIPPERFKSEVPGIMAQTPQAATLT